MDEVSDRIVPLDQLDDFEVADGDPDVRGWDVIASDGRRIGEVDQLLVDTEALKVRYLDVDLDEADRHVLIPIGYARLDESDDHVIVDQLASSELASLPEYSHEPITREMEATLRRRFDHSAMAAGEAPMRSNPATGLTPGALSSRPVDVEETQLIPDPATGAIGAVDIEEEEETWGRAADAFYSHDLYNDSRFYGARRTGIDAADELPASEDDFPLSRERGGIQRRS